MNDDSNVTDLTARLKLKAEEAAEIHTQLDLEFHLIPMVADFIDELRSEGGDDKTIGKLLRQAADELEKR